MIEQKLRILVIDDSRWNLSVQSLQGLSMHEVLTAASVGEAYRQLSEGAPFSAVLSDLWFPYEKPNSHPAYEKGMAEDRELIGDQIPAGAVFALAAASRGIPTAICTDHTHHNDRLVELMDLVPRRAASMIKVEARDVRVLDVDKNVIACDAQTGNIVCVKVAGTKIGKPLYHGYDIVTGKCIGEVAITGCWDGDRYIKAGCDSVSGRPIPGVTVLRTLKNWGLVLKRLFAETQPY